MGLSPKQVVSLCNDPATADLECGKPHLEMNPSKETISLEPETYDEGMLLLQPTVSLPISPITDDAPSTDFALQQQQQQLEVVVDNPPLVGDTKKTPTKQKKHKAGGGSAKKPPKHPRAPRGLSLDSADPKMIKEISQIARSKRARIERMKALMKTKKATTPSSSMSHRLAILFTILLCFVILLQGA